ncbi:acetyltransferase [Paenibacillus sp. J31TS4]|uniref:GNAT family N-acetyltransferase n=1 Tax=Paenibacillus sp. J31TS4 TaxID=2807195 RepID=UPI001B0905F5|nr:GNAT family N-acetyltransferase [Paenibacillus sp. J31TS4]GIP39722.1 acetyltransferase [Paenibacillus sp. J31TS4]
MMIDVALVPYEDKTILYQLLQLYQYDSSEFDGHALNQHGFYLYRYFDHQWAEEYRRPFLVRVDGELAGFALVSLGVPQAYMKLSTAEGTNTITEFFIMRKFRGKGVGKEVAVTLFNRFPGAWEIRQTSGNKNAHAFWRRVLASYKGEGGYREEQLQGDSWDGPVQVFES